MLLQENPSQSQPLILAAGLWTPQFQLLFCSQGMPDRMQACALTRSFLWSLDPLCFPQLFLISAPLPHTSHVSSWPSTSIPLSAVLSFSWGSPRLSSPWQSWQKQQRSIHSLAFWYWVIVVISLTRETSLSSLCFNSLWSHHNPRNLPRKIHPCQGGWVATPTG